MFRRCCSHFKMIFIECKSFENVFLIEWEVFFVVVEMRQTCLCNCLQTEHSGLDK
jgi:hypothetical protein